MQQVNPRAFVSAVAAEIRRMLRPPWSDVSPVAVNALIVAIGWWVLPTVLKEWMFDNLQGKLAFVIVLQTYMLCDINSTNQLGNYPAGAIAAIETKKVAQRIRLQVTALAVLIGAVCAPVALGIAIHSDGLHRTLLLMPMLMASAFAAPSVACLLGVLVPIRDRSWMWRWHNRLSWHEHLRWILLGFVLPYPIVSSLTGAYLFVCKRIADAITGFEPGVGTPPPPVTVATFSATSVALAVLVWLVGPALVAYVAQLNRRHLLSYLTTADHAPAPVTADTLDS